MDVLSAPLYVGMDITSKCNLNCLHCRTDATTKNTNYLSFSLIKKTLYDLAKLKIFELIISGGEPFIRKDIFDIIKLTITLKIPYVTVVSNGTLLNKQKIKKLKKKGLRNITISLDGLQKSHDSLRGKGNFERTIDNMSLLINNNFKVSVIMTLSEINYNDFFEMVCFVHSLGVSHVGICNLMPFGRGKNIKEKRLNISMRQTLSEKAEILKKKFGKNFLSYDYSFLCKPSNITNEGKMVQFMGCRAGRTACAILSNGDVVGCKLIPHLIAGNIKKQDLKKIWQNNSNWTVFRGDDLIGKCQTCEFGPACRGGCKALSYFEYGKINLADPRCNRFLKK